MPHFWLRVVNFSESDAGPILRGCARDGKRALEMYRKAAAQKHRWVWGRRKELTRDTVCQPAGRDDDEEIFVMQRGRRFFDFDAEEHSSKRPNRSMWCGAYAVGITATSIVG